MGNDFYCKWYEETHQSEWKPQSHDRSTRCCLHPCRQFDKNNCGLVLKDVYNKEETRWVAKGDEHTTANDLFPRCTWNDKASRCDTHQHSWCEDNVKYVDTRGDGCSTGSNPWKGRCDDIPDRALYPNINDEDWPPQDTQEWIARVRKECP